MNLQSLKIDNANYASFACKPESTRGRLYKEDESNTRTVFRRDSDRIIHSAAFRRLEYKTQVFVNHEGDHYRTRLTHSLGVAQITRGICRSLGLCEDLGEALALAHDLGHTPFGHAGEDALNYANKHFGGFDHNAQTLKILTSLEHKYAKFDGLNLTWDTLEGIAKHNGPMIGSKRDKKRYDGNLHYVIDEYNKKHDLELDSFASAEAQVAAVADDIAYNNHDIDDGLRAGLFSIAQLKELPLLGELFVKVENDYPGIEQDRLVHEAIRRMINKMVVDVTEQTIKNIDKFAVETVDDVRALSQSVVEFSKEMKEINAIIKPFLMKNMYRHYKVCRMTRKAKEVVKDLYERLFNYPDCLPTEWQSKEVFDNEVVRAEVVTDFIAGMTDRFAMQEHQKLFNIYEL